MGGQGIDMLVPTLLELGTEEQKKKRAEELSVEEFEELAKKNNIGVYNLLEAIKEYSKRLGRTEASIKKIIKKLESMRDQEVKELAEVLENHLNDRISNGRNSVKARPQNKKKGSGSNRSRNRKTVNTKPQS